MRSAGINDTCGVVVYLSTRFVYSDLMMDPIVFHGIEAELIKTVEFTRLAGIKQLSTVYLFHPNATHTRWNHSLGMAGIIKSFINAQKPEDTPRISDQYLLVSAALTHDIGHSAWSHVGEVFSAMRGNPIKHDQISAELVLGEKKHDKYFAESYLPRVSEIITDESQRQQIANLILGKPPIPKNCTEEESLSYVREKMYMANMIKGPADFDHAEYIMRDSFMCTSFHGLVDLRGIVQHLGILYTPTKTRILAYIDLNFAEALILALELQYSSVYLQKSNLMAEELLIRALERAYPPDVDLMYFWLSTDQEVTDKLRQVSQKDEFVKKVLKLMNARTTYPVLDEINLLDSRLDNNSKANIKYFGGNEGKPIMREFEKNICCDLKVNDGDVIIGSWIWKQPETAQAAVLIKGRVTTVGVESRLLEVLRSEPYVDSRSKLIIGADKKVVSEIGRDKIISYILDMLKTEDYMKVT